jgi:hypothetical protein
MATSGDQPIRRQAGSEATSQMDLVSWLTAQLDHDEQEIRRRLAVPEGFVHDGPCVNYEGQNPADRDEYDSCSRHVAAMEAARQDRFPYRDLDFALRQVAAYRRILSRHQPRPDGTPSGVECSVCVDPDGRCDSWQRHEPLDWPCPDVRDLASIYEFRPGFDPSWTVE